MRCHISPEICHYLGNYSQKLRTYRKEAAEKHSIVLELIFRLGVVRIELISTDKAMEIKEGPNSRFGRKVFSLITFELRKHVTYWDAIVFLPLRRIETYT